LTEDFIDVLREYYKETQEEFLSNPEHFENEVVKAFWNGMLFGIKECGKLCNKFKEVKGGFKNC